MSPVTPENMVGVEIKPGWFTASIERYLLQYQYRSIENNQPTVFGDGFRAAVLRLDQELVSKNTKYESAWLTDYILTSLADLKDKLYRLKAATRKGGWVEWDDQKRRGTYYDILARTLMLMALEDANAANLEGVIDDD